MSRFAFGSRTATAIVLALLATLLASVFAARTAHGGVAAALDFDARARREATESSPFALRLAPSLEVQARAAHLMLAGTTASLNGGLEVEAARASAMLAFGGRRALRPELLLDGSHTRPVDEPARDRMRAQARLRFATWFGAAWLGAGMQASSPREPGPQRALLGLGGDGRLGSFALSGALEQSDELRIVNVPGAFVPQPDSLLPPIQLPGHSDHSSLTATHAHGRLGWARGPLAVETIAGLTFAPHQGPRRWMQAGATLAITPRVALVTTAGTPAPEWFALEPSGERHATLGVRITSLPAPGPDEALSAIAPRSQVAWRVVRLEHQRYEIHVRAPHARNVEIMGDMTGWEPVALKRSLGGRFFLPLELAPGVHRVNLRIDGGPWTAPPGAATSPDEFGGEVGVITVE
jgi:hypothetical protein